MHRPASAMITVASEPYAGDGPQWVVTQPEAELVARHRGLDDGERALTAAMFDPPVGTFLVGRAGPGGPPVGGVGVRALGPGLGEVRRLWVDPGWRGQGVARRLMTALEDAAPSFGLRALRLVTGERQSEAVALYESSGWERIEVGGAICGLRVTKAL